MAEHRTEPAQGPEQRLGIDLHGRTTQDRLEEGDWIHVARGGGLSTYDEGLWQVAEWFTGDGSKFQELMPVNGLSSPELRPGQLLRIPAALLHGALGARMASDDGSLEFASDDRGL